MSRIRNYTGAQRTRLAIEEGLPSTFISESKSPIPIPPSCLKCFVPFAMTRHVQRGLCGVCHPATMFTGTLSDFPLTKPLVNGGYVTTGRYAHRHIIETELGRPLHPHERVVHLNAVRDDNRPSNLVVETSLVPKSKRIEDIIAFAEMIKSIYP